MIKLIIYLVLTYNLTCLFVINTLKFLCGEIYEETLPNPFLVVFRFNNKLDLIFMLDLGNKRNVKRNSDILYRFFIFFTFLLNFY